MVSLASRRYADMVHSDFPLRRRPPRRWRAAAIAAILLGLTGCWSGPPIFDTSEAVPAIADGGYIVRERSGADAPRRIEPGEIFLVRRQADNSLKIFGPDDEDGVEAHRVIAAALPALGKARFVLQVERHGERGDVGYMLLDTRQTPNLIIIPGCGVTAREAVEASGGYVSRDPNTGSQCIFRNASVLREQLGRIDLSAVPKGSELELVRVSDAAPR